MTVNQAAAFLGCSRRTIVYQINHGHLKATRFGTGQTSPWMVDAADAERLKAERCHEECEDESSA